ncbi:MAG: tetratricopeptide repeat protein [Sphingobium sp.]
MRMRFVALAVALLGLAAPGTLYAEWRQAHSRNFILYSKANDRETRKLVEQLEKFDRLLRNITRISSDVAVVPLRVYLFDNAGLIRKLARSPYAAGFYSTGSRYAYAVAWRQSPASDFGITSQAILFHEYAHHFMHQYFPAAYPAWYVEGFAEFFSTVEFEEDGGVRFGLIPKFRAPTLLRMSIFPLDQLFSRTPEKLGGIQGDRYYGTAWLLTHFFHANDARQAEFHRYLGDLGAGREPDADTVFSGGIRALSKDLTVYMGKRLSVWGMPAREMVIPPVTLTTLDPAHDALVETELRLLSRDGRERDEAIDIDQVRTIVGRFPDSAYASVVLADAELAVGNIDQAHAAADRAILLDPAESTARVEAARARIWLERAERSDSAEDWQAALNAIVRANRADLNDPVPLVLFYRYHRMKGGSMPGVGYDGLYKALEILPQNQDYRMMLAHAMASRGDYAMASRLLNSIAFSPHGSPLRDAAARLKAEYDAKVTSPAP